MQSVFFVVDNSSDINSQLARELGINLVMSSVDWPEEKGLEGRDIYEKMRKAKTFPKTSAVPTGSYKKAFEGLLENGGEVICITPSPGISGDINSARLARSLLPENQQEKIFILNSQTGLGAYGLLAIKGISLAREGKRAREIIKILENQYMPETHLLGIIENMKWVEAGGRISHGLAMLSDQLARLRIRPLIGIQGGKIKPIGVKVNIGRFSQALFDACKVKIDRGSAKEKFNFFISYTDNLPEAQLLENLLRENLGIGNIYLEKLNIVVGCHTGPGTLFLACSPV